MLKRIFDVFISLSVLIAVSPLIVFGAIGIYISSRGPIIYRAKRVGRDGVSFSMYKLRSMHVESDQASAITAPGDIRIFSFGAFIRKLKIDELPQFFNVLKGEMSIVGPRPEDTKIVEEYYTDWMRETLHIRPGITSPGAIFGYTRGDAYLDPNDPEGSYTAQQMPVKLAIERAYIEHSTFTRDIGVCFSTIGAIAATMMGKNFDVNPILRAAAVKWAPHSAYLTDLNRGQCSIAPRKGRDF